MSVKEWRRTLIFHEKHQEDCDLRVNSKMFPEVKINDIIEIIALGLDSVEEIPRANRFYIKVEIIQPLKGNFHLSISSNLCELFNIRKTAKQEVIVRVINPEIVALDFVELTFRDQYISRGDMWRFKSQLLDQFVHRNKVLSISGLRVLVDEMLVNMNETKCGLITNETKLIFRSRSARMFWLIQLSEEMWNFNQDGQLYFEKVVNSFLKTLFSKWEEIQANHSISIIFFSRTFYQESTAGLEANTYIGDQKPNLFFHVDSRGRFYQDHYKVIVDFESRESWDSLVRQLKAEFLAYPNLVKWGTIDPATGFCGKPSNSKDGNVLEALNLSLNVCDKHYMNRELQFTGLSINVLSAGMGVFEVSRDLSQFTKQRVIDNGISCDFVFMQDPPLHNCPLFIYRNTTSNIAKRPSDIYSFHYPHWITVSFYGTNVNKILKGSSNFVPLPSHRMVELTVEELSSRMGIFNDETDEEPTNNLMDDEFLDKTVSVDKFVRKPAWMTGIIGLTDLKREEKSETSSLCETMTMLTNLSNKSKYKPLESKHAANIRIRNMADMEIYDSALFSDNSSSISKILPSMINIPTIPHVSLADNNHSFVSNLLNRRKNSPAIKANAVVTEPPILDLALGASKPKEKKDENKKQLLDQILSQKIASRKMVSKYLINASNSSNGCVIESVRVHDVFWMSDALKRAEKSGRIQALSEITTEILAPFLPSYNPFKKIVEIPKHSYNRSRWVHVYSSSEYLEIEESRKVNWKSLTKPAILPLTTDYFPTSLELASGSFIQYPNTVSLVPNENVFGNNPDFLLQELIAQRLAQDFQLTVVSKHLEKSTNNNNIVVAEKGENEGKKKFYHLAIDGQFHSLTLDSETGNIFAMRWVSKESKPVVSSYNFVYPYRYFLWCPMTSTFNLWDIELAMNHDEYKWNFLDQLIAGYHSNLLDSLKYRRVRFAIIPADISAVNAVGIPVISRDKSDQVSVPSTEDNSVAIRKNRISQFKKVIDQILSPHTFEKLGVSVLDEQLVYPPLDSFVCDRYAEERFYSAGFGNCSIQTEELMMNLKSQMADRSEWCMIQYDTLFHPDAAFHIEIHWLSAAGVSIEDFVQMSRRKCRNCSFKMIQIPVQQPLKMSDPFHQHATVYVSSLEISELIQHELISKYGFLVDGVSRTGQRQYIHNTGMSLIRIKAGNLFYYSNHLRFTVDLREESFEMYRKIKTRVLELSNQN